MLVSRYFVLESSISILTLRVRNFLSMKFIVVMLKSGQTFGDCFHPFLQVLKGASAENPSYFYRMSQKRFMHLTGYGRKGVYPKFKAKFLIYRSKANIDEKIWFDKITHL